MKKLFTLLLLPLVLPFASSCSDRQLASAQGAESFEKSNADTVDKTVSDDSPREEMPVFSYEKYAELDTLTYVALGDSIARGYSLAEPSENAYPAQIAKVLKNSLPKTEVDFTNYGVDGLTTEGLSELIENGCDALDGAQLVTVCIGANDILGPFLNTIEKYYAEFIPADKAYSNAALINGIRALEAELESREFEELMQAGIEKVKKNYPRIIELLKARAPDAEIILMTVYSPYHGIDLSLPYLDISLDIGSISDRWVTALNEAVRAAASESGCVLAETYDAFEKHGGLVNASLTLMPLSINYDPHPNLYGHTELAKLHLALMQ